MELTRRIEDAAAVIRDGGVVAYPTEYCFGLGCDPTSIEAVNRILQIKRRRASQGLIVVAASVYQLRPWLSPAVFKTDRQLLDAASASWPGPVTWLLPANSRTSRWVRGNHPNIAVRVSAHPAVVELCRRAATAIVSTSANRHGELELRTADQVRRRLGKQIDLILEGRCFGAPAPTALVDAASHRVLRGTLPRPNMLSTGYTRT